MRPKGRCRYAEVSLSSRIMKKLSLCLAIAALAAAAAAAQPAGRQPFNEGWTFEKDGVRRVLDLPHDWGVEGAFSQEYPGETGNLPWWGKAPYTKTLEITAEDLRKDIDLEIDGAMSDATVLVQRHRPRWLALRLCLLRGPAEPGAERRSQRDRRDARQPGGVLPLVPRRRHLPQCLAHP